MGRGLETLAIFERFCHANRLADEDVHVFATSAIRDASNREPFLQRVQEATGYEIEVLSTPRRGPLRVRGGDQQQHALRRRGAGHRGRQHAGDRG